MEPVEQARRREIRLADVQIWPHILSVDPGYLGDDDLADTFGRVLRAANLTVAVTVHPLQAPAVDRRTLAAGASPRRDVTLQTGNGPFDQEPRQPGRDHCQSEKDKAMDKDAEAALLSAIAAFKKSFA